MPFRYFGLDPAPFAALHALDDDALVARGMRRVVADSNPGFPCRVSLEDAAPGERLLLLPFEHQPARSPYRASGPIFVREGARAACDHTGTPPLSLLSRLLSVRSYAADGMMIDADTVEGHEIETLLARFFADAQAQCVHVHYARRGCYAARVARA